MAVLNPFRTGLIVGHERGRLDLIAGQRRDLKDLWLPTGAPPEFVEGLYEGYLKGVIGEPGPRDDFEP